jgi:hypothetical protein
MLPPINVLRARAEARAVLFAAGVFPIEEAMQPLLVYAEQSGLIKQFGQAVVESVIFEPFKPHIQRN